MVLALAFDKRVEIERIEGRAFDVVVARDGRGRVQEGKRQGRAHMDGFDLVLAPDLHAVRAEVVGIDVEIGAHAGHAGKIHGFFQEGQVRAQAQAFRRQVRWRQR